MPKFFPQFSDEFAGLLGAVKGKKVAVVGHLRPDGDCVASQFALADLFEKAGAADVLCLNKHPLPCLYESFSYGRSLLPLDDFARTDYEIVTVDCADYARVGAEFAARFPKPLGCIDHHASNTPYARINILDPKAAATAELIAGLMLDAGMKISAENANRLYMGLAMDTRQFTTSSTTLKSFLAATALVESGASPADVAVQLYQRERFAKLKLLSYYLQSLTMHLKDRVCLGILPLGVFERTGSMKEDTDGLVDYARSIDGVEIAVLLEELPNGVKGSLRSKDPKYRVDGVAGAFGGGGHKNAAGFSVDGITMNEFVPKLLSIIEERLNSNL